MPTISLSKNSDGSVDLRVYAQGSDAAPGVSPGSIEYFGTISSADWTQISSDFAGAGPVVEKFYKHTKTNIGRLSSKK